MNIKLIGHASIQVTNDKGIKLLTDPWLISPAFWGSWFHLPEPVYNDDIFDVDYIYFTHWHFDHFDYKSIRKFNRNCKIFIPKFPSSILKRELNKMGFNYVTEMTHKKKYTLEKNFNIISHQIEHHDDSVLCIEVDNKTIINLNDAKPLPSSWKWLIKNYYNPDFIFRSHSLAWSFPTRYEFESDNDKETLDQELYIKEFAQSMDYLKPKYAIPFASYICHPHKSNQDQNHHLITPYMVEEYLKYNPVNGSIFKILNPGGEYDSIEGFKNIKHYDFEIEFDKIKNKYGKFLSELYVKESNHNFDINSVHKYFKNFFNSVFIFKFFLKRCLWIFKLEELGLIIVVDFETKRSYSVSKIDEIKKPITAIIKVSPYILEESLNKLIFSNIDVAKRWHVFIKEGMLQKHLFLTALISIYEAGVIPLYKNIYKPRFILGYLRRMPELLDYVFVLFRFKRSIKEAREFVSGVK